MSSKQKLSVALVFQMHQSTGHLKAGAFNSISFLITKYHFTIGNLALKQQTGTPIGIDPASYWANHFLHFFESKCVQQLISKGLPRAYKFYGTSRFT